jgi:hypothetical protein
VDDVRDLVLGQRARDRLRVGDVALDVRDRLELCGRRDEAKAPVVDAQVERDDAGALARERGDGPGTEAAECPGDEPALRRLRRQ